MIRYRVDDELGTVEASLAGFVTSSAIFADELGCRVTSPAAVKPTKRAGSLAFVPADGAPSFEHPEVQSFVEKAMRDGSHGLPETKAIVVLKSGQMIAQAYADGYNATTPIPGFSLGKSVTNAIAGAMVHAGQLRVEHPVALLDRRGAKVGSDIRFEQLLRMASGPDLDEAGSGFDPANHMLYVHVDDMAGFARRATVHHRPGERFAYSSASTHLAMREMQGSLSARGGNASAFARTSLFEPAGIESMVMEADGTGTPRSKTCP